MIEDTIEIKYPVEKLWIRLKKCKNSVILSDEFVDEENIL